MLNFIRKITEHGYYKKVASNNITIVLKCKKVK